MADEVQKFVLDNITAYGAAKSAGYEGTYEEFALALRYSAEHLATVTESYVHNWLDAHPEITTSVQDNSLTFAKMVVGTLGYVTPEMFGAQGNGTTDDSTAFASALNVGLPVNLAGKTYRITSVITASGCTIYSGTIKLVGNGRITGTNLNLSDVTFDCSGITAYTQKTLSLTGGKNVVQNCNFGSMTARDFAYQIDCENCDAYIDGCHFDIVRITEVNGTQGDNYGVGRHVKATSSNVTISNNVFNGFYGGDDNYLEDCDCVHISNCDFAAITNNLFKGYWKSAVKNQHKSMIVSGNRFDSSAGWYIIRSHNTTKMVIITDNILSGLCDDCLYFEGNAIKVMNNLVNVDAMRFVLTANEANVECMDNQVNLSSHSGIHRAYNEDEAAVFECAGGTLVSNSTVVADTHKPYYFKEVDGQWKTINCNLTGKIQTGYTPAAGTYYIMRACSGTIYIDTEATFFNCDGLEVISNGSAIIFTDCTNIRVKESPPKAITLRGCTNVYAEITYSASTYAVDIYDSQNVVIKLYGTAIANNIVAVADATSTGVAVNYISAAQNIYNRNSVTLNFKAKSMLV